MEEKDIFAFPLTDGKSFANDEMTLRDYFAAKAMQGLFSNYELLCSLILSNKENARDKELDTIPDQIAQESYKMADAMLKKRSYTKNKKHENDLPTME